MSYEQTVKEKHRFEKAVQDFLKYAAVMSNNEIEISMARLADTLVVTANEGEKHHLSIKGSLLQKYLECRVSGMATQSKMLRLLYRGEMKEYFTEKGMENYQLASLEHENQKKIKEEKFQQKLRAHNKEWMDWKLKVSQLSFSKRIFSKPPEPEEPIREPSFSMTNASVYVDSSKAKADMGEFLIAKTAEFILVYVPKDVDDYKPVDIKLLAHG